MYVILLWATLLVASTNGLLDFFIHHSCGDHQYRCTNGQCVPSENRCDGHEDCGDSSDETDCEIETCAPPNFFKCNNSTDRCISSAFVCDGENDCLDFSDEENCEAFKSIMNSTNTSCKENEWKCSDNICVHNDFVCNGETDCPDGSDETLGCSKHIEVCDGFKCDNGHCIPIEFRCDRADDCRDNSDEINCETHINPADCTLNAGKFLCHDNKTCIDVKKACNDHPDCPDQSDESGQCSNFCNHGHCSHDCVRLPTGPKCLCPAGYKTIDDRTCEDINECEIYGICDQYCENLDGSYKCSCDPGYNFETDGRTCKAIGTEVGLIFSTRHEIRSFMFQTNSLQTVVSHLNQSVGVDADQGFIYWTDIDAGHECISRISTDGTGRELLVTAGLGATEDLAIDWVVGNIYFTDLERRHIGVCTKDGVHCTVIVDKGIDQPRGIALHPKYGEMYWTDWGAKPQIRKSLMDGTDDTIFISSNIHWPNDLIVDYPNDRLYWTDAKRMTLESIKLDRTDRRIILEDIVKHPYGIAIFENKIYWSDWATHSIQSCNKFTGKNHTTLIKEEELIYGITIYHPASLQEVENPCLKAFCSDICLLSGTSFTCACPSNKELNRDNRTCREIHKKQILIVGAENTLIQVDYKNIGNHKFRALPSSVKEIGALAYNPINNTLYVSDLRLDKIISMSLHSDFATPLDITGLGKITAMDYDHLGNNLYWCDQEKATIEVLNLNTMSRRTLVYDMDGEIPESITLVPEEGIMFVSFVQHDKKESHIDRILMDGTGRTHCVEDGLVGPISLLYDKDLGRVFFSDATVGNIELISIDCDERHGFSGRSDFPISLASLNKDLFWVDLNSNKILYTDKTNQDYNLKIIPLDVDKVERLHIISVTPERVGVSPCQIQNGNCSHLCLISQKNVVCACPIGYNLENDNKTCSKRVECERDDFNCPNSNQCIPKSFRCNAHLDCRYGEDEEHCQNFKHCPSGSFQCNDGECIKETFVCNSKYDCLDKSDEHNCSHLADSKCPPGHFECNNGNCIGEQFVCDGSHDCAEEEDEANCAKSTCFDYEFRCASGACIPKNWECDHKYDCSDLSDEHAECEPCPSTSFVCNNGECLDSGFVCDGEEDCDDGSDEEHCEIREDFCKPNEFSCSSNKTICIPNTAICDGASDCPHHEDEANCSSCHIEEFTCHNKKCISVQWICDRTDDCGDRSDEDPDLCLHNVHEFDHFNPLMPCDNGFRCKSSQCLEFDKVCNGKTDCFDGSDEGGLCSTACESRNNPCSQICTKTPVGPVCHCEKGYSLKGDGHRCEDDNECTADPPVCSQICVNQPGSFFCDCYTEFLLTADKKSCKSVGKAMSMIFTSNNQVRELSQSENSLKLLHSADDSPKITGLDVDVSGNYIYFSIEQAETILRVNRETKETDQIIRIGNPQKLALDWITHNIYFVNKSPNSKSIKICNFDQKATATITVPIDFQHRQFTSIAVDPINKYLFYSLVSWWMFNSPSFEIYRTNLDGGDVHELVKSTKGHVTGLAYDLHKKQLFYIDQYNEELKQIYYNGSMSQTLIRNLTRATGLNFFENHLYFLGKNGFMMKCKLYDDASCEKFKLNNYATHFAIFQESRQITRGNLCENHTCTHLCIPTNEHYKCLCKDGTSVDPEEKCPTFGREANEDENELFLPHHAQHAAPEKEHKSGLVAAGIIIPFLSVSIVLGLYYVLKKRNRRNFDMSLRYHNPIYNLQTDDVEEKSILQPGMHEYTNPVAAKNP